jgi:hypothetical protein
MLTSKGANLPSISFGEGGFLCNSYHKVLDKTINFNGIVHLSKQEGYVNMRALCGYLLKNFLGVSFLLIAALLLTSVLGFSCSGCSSQNLKRRAK